MAIHDLLWACPDCGVTGGVRRLSGSKERCVACGTTFRRGRGASIVAARDGQPDRVLAAAEWLARLPAIEERFPDCDATVRGPERVVLRVAQQMMPVRLNGELLGWAERFGPRRAAVLTLRESSLRVETEDDALQALEVPLDQLTAIQASSSTLQVGSRERPVLSLRFKDSSVLLWEHLLRARARRRFRELGLGEITEWQPAIRTARTIAGPGESRPPARNDEKCEAGIAERPLGRAFEAHVPAPETSARPGGLYRLCQWIVGTAWRTLGRLDVQGLENIPTRGPFLLVCNHQSDLDPLLIQSVIQRRVHALAKSTLFHQPVVRWIIPRIAAMPVRRYQTDAQAVRMALRRLTAGWPVGVFIEGERSWDGRLQEPKPGTVRLALKAGVPIVPCVISGAYDASPRWHSRIQPGSVSIRFLPAICFPAMHRRPEREAARELAGRRIMEAIAGGLSGRL